MERARHRKSKSASGIEGIRHQKQKAVSSLSSHARSYIDESNRDDMFMHELGNSPLRGVAGKPMKKLLAEEMSKEVESKRRTPSVIARLMGLEGLPSPRHVHRQPKRFSESLPQRNVSSNIQRNSQPYEGRSNRRRSTEQQEFKDVYEDLEASHVANRRCSSRWSASSILTKPEMALIQQKFLDAKRLSTDEKLQDSKELDDTLEMLDSNKDLLLRFLWQPNSLFMKHLHDGQVDPGNSLGSHIAVLKPSNSEKYENKVKVFGSEKNTSSKHHATSHVKRQDGLLLESHSRRRGHTSRNSTQLDAEKGENILPTRIVVLKPNLGKTQKAATSNSSPDFSRGYHPSLKKIKEFQSVGGNETESRRRKDSSHKMGLSKSMSKEAREIAREITTRMRDGSDETMDAKSSGFRGYIGDESSYDPNESDSGSESEVFKSCRKSFDGSNLCRYPSSSLFETSVNREAKKRLSERWKMSHKYQDLEMISKGSTLGEMLAFPDRETRPNRLNVKTSLGNNGTATGDFPLGISSRDGWKDEISRNPSRSRSLPPYTGGRGRTHRITYHDEVAEDKKLRRSGSERNGRSKVLKGNLCNKEDSSSKDSKSRSKKPRPCQYEFLNEIDSSSEANFEIQMEANSKNLSEEHSVFQMNAKSDTCRSPPVDVMMVSRSGNSTLPSEYPGHNSIVHNEDDSSLQVLHNGPPKQGSSSLQCLGAEPDYPSPISVLEVPFTEETSSSESFERVGAELHELRMQLQLLKMEKGTCAEAFTLVPIEEEVTQPSPKFSEDRYELGDQGWEISYVLDVLIDSGIEESDFNIFETSWYSRDCPLDPKLFNKLEKKYSDENSSSERRLLFDKVNSALLEIFEEHVDLWPWVMPKLAGQNCKMQNEGIRDAIEKLINQDFASLERLDRELDRDMQWSGFKGEIDIIGSEIEKLLIDDMIIEVLCN
ncbi:hypothetical protein ABFS83_10G036600 [Erythranthe nasuta]